MDADEADEFRKALAESQVEDDRAQAEVARPQIRRRATMASGAQSLVDQLVGGLRSVFTRGSE